LKEVPDEFAKFFDTKVKNIILSVNIKEEVYNGTKKVNKENKMFMDKDSIRLVMESMKIKNSEGFDRIPQRIIKEGIENLLEPFAQLFKRIYTQRAVPDQWLLAKTIPIHNKGPKMKYLTTDLLLIYVQYLRCSKSLF
jgi:hypothetical protein